MGGLGMEKLWYTSQNMRAHPIKPFYLHVSSENHGLVHGSMHAFSYAELAEDLGLNYTAYYLDQPGRRNTAVSAFAARLQSSKHECKVVHEPVKYVSSFHWGSVLKSRGWGCYQSTVGEHLDFIAYAFGLPLPLNPYGS